MGEDINPAGNSVTKTCTFRAEVARDRLCPAVRSSLTLLGTPDTGEPIDRVAEAHSALQLLVMARPQPRSGPVWRIRIQDPSRRHLEIYLVSSLYKFENSYLEVRLWRFIASGPGELLHRK